MKNMCPACGKRLEPSKFPDLKKAAGKEQKFENKLICKNFPECKEAVRE